MAKSQIVKTVSAPAPIIVRPDYIPASNEGTQLLAKYISPPRLKLIQAMTKAEVKEQFGEGSAVIMPQGVTVCEMKYGPKGAPDFEKVVPFTVIPLFFFEEWICLNDLKATAAGEPMILERSLNANSQVAIKARDAHRRKAVHPQNDKWVIKYQECLNFVVISSTLVGAETEPFVISFRSGLHAAGRALSKLIRSRQAAIYSGQYDMWPAKKMDSTKQHEFWSLESRNSAVPWVDPELMSWCESKYHELLAVHKDQLLVVEYEDDATDDSNSVENQEANNKF